MDTLAVRLTLPTTKRVVDFHHQAIAHGGRTRKAPAFVSKAGTYYGAEGGICLSSLDTRRSARL